MLRDRAKPVLGAVLFMLSFCSGSAKKAKRWTYPRPQWPVPGHRMDPEPCRLFAWNVVSAVRFCQCSRLVKSAATKTLWKDSHGQLWLRMPASSPLLKLFPCQQHSLSRCAKCGHDYRAHVKNTLRKRKDRPYDKAVRLFQEAAERKSRRKGGDAAAIQDFRGASVFSDKRKARRDPGAGASFGGLRRWGGNRAAPTPDGETATAAAAGTASAAATATDGPSPTGRQSRSDRRNKGNGPSGGGNLSSSVDWRRRLAVLAEAQRAALMQTAGVPVTSTEARAAYRAERDRTLRAKAAREQAEAKKDGRRGDGRGGVGGGASARARKRRRRKERGGHREGDWYGGASGGGGVGGFSDARGEGARSGRDGWGGGGRSGRSRGRSSRHGNRSTREETEDYVAQRNLRTFDRVEYV